MKTVNQFPSSRSNWCAFQVRQGRQQLNMVGSGTTNDLGEYRVFGVAPGKYYLRATGQRSGSPFGVLDRSANSQPEEDYVPTYYPGTIDTANAASVEVGSGAQVSGINFTLLKTATVHIKGTVGNLPPGVRQPIQIMMVPRNVPFIGGPLRPIFADAKGNFDIRGVAPGQYMLSANVNDGGRSYSASVPVDVGNSNMENVSLAIGRGVDIDGKIRIEGDTKRDLTTVNVNLRPRDTSGIVFGGAGARVKDDNTFQLQNAGANIFEVTLFGLPDGFYVKSIKSGETDVLAAGLDVAKGGPQPLEVVLSPNAGSVSGAVQNTNTRQPAPGATVVLVPQEKERRDRAEYYKTTTTDQNGNYTLKGLVPGEYKAYAWEDVEPGAYMDSDFLKPVESKAESVTVRESDQKTVALTMIPADTPAQSETGQMAQRN